MLKREILNAHLRVRVNKDELEAWKQLASALETDLAVIVREGIRQLVKRESQKLNKETK